MDVGTPTPKTLRTRLPDRFSSFGGPLFTFSQIPYHHQQHIALSSSLLRSTTLSPSPPVASSRRSFELSSVIKHYSFREAVPTNTIIGVYIIYTTAAVHVCTLYTTAVMTRTTILCYTRTAALFLRPGPPRSTLGRTTSQIIIYARTV